MHKSLTCLIFPLTPNSMLANPTSPLGSGGLAWYICFQPLFFSTLRVSTLWGGVYPSPYTPSPGPWTSGVQGRWGLLLRLFSHLVALHFFIVFSMPFLSDLGSILPPNLAPKIHKNRSNIDAKMPSHVDLNFSSIFDRFLLPTWISESRKFTPPLQ